jgi:putative salt-induced outer membrane protein YdiY
MSTQPLHIVLSDGRVIVGRVTTSDGTLEIATDGGTVPAAHDAVKAIRDNATQAEIDRLQHPRLLDYWSGLFDLGLSLTECNSSTSALTIAGKASRVAPKNKFTLYYTQVYARDNNQSPSVTTANAIHGGVRDDFNLTEKLYAFGFTDFDEDALQHLDLRNVLGGGIGLHVLKTKNTQFDVFGGASFNQEIFCFLYHRESGTPSRPPTAAITDSSQRRDRGG